MALTRFPPDRPIVIFLSGDVMTGRGVDQILTHAGDPALHECYLKDAREYLALAERKSGPIAYPVDDAYIWGDALTELERATPAARIVNLETSITASSDAWPKGINYRMHPANVGCLTRAGIDCCLLANNHVLDWGYRGLEETLQTLRGAGIATAGAGLAREAAAPAILPMAGQHRLLIYAAGTTTSGIPARWCADDGVPGVNLLHDLSAKTVNRLGAQIRAIKGEGDLAIFSIHWGGNWGYEIPDDHRRFAHQLIDNGGVDVVHGHSSHHVMGIEVYRNRPILYGAGDLLNDYEGIGGYESFRSDLALLYLVALDPATGELREWHLVPMQVRRFQLHRASPEDIQWLCHRLNRESSPFGTRVEMTPDGILNVLW